MNKNFISAMYVMNIVFQCILTLLMPAAFMLFVAWLLVTKLGAPSWIYALLIVAGVIIGLVSMVKFAISASEGLERLEKQNSKRTKNNTNRREK